MPLLTRRRFVDAAAAAAGLLFYPRLLRAALTPPGCPPRVVIPTTESRTPLIMVAAAGVDLDPTEVPELYRVGVHVCFPPSQRACWCGGWHQPDDPANFLIVAGHDAGKWRFGDDRHGLAVLPSDQRPHPDLSTLRVPAKDLLLTTTRIIEQIAEGLLVPGLCGYDLVDLRTIIERRRELRFAYSASAADIANATHQLVATSAGWLPKATGLLMRHTSNDRTLIYDVSKSCDLLIGAANDNTNALFYITLSPGSSLSVVGVLAAC